MRRVLILALLLAACGKVGHLAPTAGHALPPKPAEATAAPTPEKMLVLPPQSQPIRVDDPLSKSEERTPDKFDLPPPGR